MNSPYIISVIVTIFIVIGIALPYVERSFGQDVNEPDLTGFQEEVEGHIDDSVSLLDVAGSVVKMFFWTFGSLPAWLDSLFIILRIMLLVAIAEVILP